MTDQQAQMGEVCADDGTAGDDGAREIYRERAHLVALLATIYPAALIEHEPHHPAPSAPAIRDVVYLETSRGQLSWHVHPDDVDELFRHVGRVLPDDLAGKYDGHTTAPQVDGS
jgi:hypothetical protein